MAMGMVWPIVKASPAGKLMEAGEEALSLNIAHFELWEVGPPHMNLGGFTIQP